MFFYRVFGMVFCSDVRIREFRQIDPVVSWDVTLRKNPVEIPEEIDRSKPRVMINYGRGLLMYWREIGVFLIEEGNLVTFWSTTSPERPGLIDSVLIGPVLGILMFQRKSHYVYHSSVVGKDDGKGALAFISCKGGGKSTMAVSMIKCGYSLVSDDLLAVGRNRDGYWVEPGFPGMKLWHDSAKQIFDDISHLPSIGGDEVDYDKRIAPMNGRYLDSPLPLNSVFLLDYDEGETPRIEELSKKETLFYLMPHWYGSMFNGQLLPLLGKQRLLDESAFLAETGRVFRLIRPRNLDKVDLSMGLVDDLRKKLCQV